jgi:hypothetical protein
MAYARRPDPLNAADPFKAAAKAVDRALRSKDSPIVQAATAVTAAADETLCVSPEAVGNGTPANGRLPLGMGAPTRPWRPRAGWRKRRPALEIARAEMTTADAEILAAAWWRQAVASRRGPGWRHVAFVVRKLAVAGEEGAAMRADARWWHVARLARKATQKGNGPVTGWVRRLLGSERRQTRRAIRMVARAILARAGHTRTRARG